MTMLVRRFILHVAVVYVGTTCWTSAVKADQADVQPRPAVCKLTAFHTGVCQIGKDHVLGPKYTANERMPFIIYAFLAEGPNGEKALIDLGPKTVQYCNRMFRTHGLFRDLGPGYVGERRYPDDIVQPYGNVFDHLNRLKVAPTEIDHIVFTHLHADHHGMDNAKSGGATEGFPNAVLHVSRIGWNENLDKRKDGKWNSYVDYAFSDFLQRRQRSGKVRFEDNTEVFPGLRTLYLGGHSTCSQAVVVDTTFGTAIITSDEVYHYQLLADDLLPRIHSSETAYRTAIRRLVTLARREDGILVPLHDPLVWETCQRAGPNWLRELKIASDQAIAGYLKN